jgi:uncharacterized protein (DUF3084 family)
MNEPSKFQVALSIFQKTGKPPRYRDIIETCGGSNSTAQIAIEELWAYLAKRIESSSVSAVVPPDLISALEKLLVEYREKDKAEYIENEKSLMGELEVALEVNKAQQEKLEAILAANQKITNEVIALTSSNQSLQNELSECRRARAEEMQKKDSLQNGNLLLQQALDNLTAQHKALSDRHAALTIEVSELKTANGLHVTELNKKETEMSAITKQLQEAEKVVAIHETNLSALTGNNERLAAELRKADIKIVAMQSKIYDAEIKASIGETKASVLEKEVAGLTLALGDAQITANQLNKELGSLSAIKDQYDKLLSEYKTPAPNAGGDPVKNSV